MLAKNTPSRWLALALAVLGLLVPAVGDPPCPPPPTCTVLESLPSHATPWLCEPGGEPPASCNPTGNPRRELPVYPKSVTGEHYPCSVAYPNFWSQCWGFVDHNSTGRPPDFYQRAQGWAWANNRANLDPRWGPTAGDYAPRTPFVATSSLPLVPNEIRSERLVPEGMERPVLADSLDLITGKPLIQQIDFVLPFGSAEFRHVRTYSTSGVPGLDHVAVAGQATATSQYYDWCGQGWMLGVNPAFLIDTTALDINSDEHPRCYFLPDAHRAIPFLFDPTTGRYFAEPRFGARLTHNRQDEWVPPASGQPGHWSGEPPTEYTVWLHNDSLKYTIKAYRDDVPVIQAHGAGGSVVACKSAHERTVASDLFGLDLQYLEGMAYFGRVKSIEDRQGNRVVIGHEDDIDSATDGFRQSAVPEQSATGDCTMCAQNCVEKGQVRYVKLYPAGSTVAEWTLVYQHRRFDGVHQTDWMSCGFIPISGHPVDIQKYGWMRTGTAVNAIYVYRRDVDLQVEIDRTKWKWSCDGRLFWKGRNASEWADYDTGAFDGVSYRDIEGIVDNNPLESTLFGDVGLPVDKLVHRMSYLYREAFIACAAFGYGSRPRVSIEASQAFPSAYSFNWHTGPYLIKATLLTVPGTNTLASNAPPHRQSWLYRYAGIFEGGVDPLLTLGYDHQGIGEHPLKAIYEPSTVASLVEAMRAEETPACSPVDDICLMMLPDYYTIRIDRTNAPDLELSVLDHADVRYDHNVYNTSTVVDATTVGSVVEDYLKADRTRLIASTNWPAVAVKDPLSGEPIRYRVVRFLQLPQSAGSVTLGANQYVFSNVGDVFRGGPGIKSGNRYERPDRSLMHVPYRWQRQGETSDSFGGLTPVGPLPPPSMSEPTWLAVVDRCESWQVATSYVGLGDEQDLDDVESRRAIQINAAGMVLREEAWQFDGTGATVVARSGSAVEHIYGDCHRIVERRSRGWSTLTPSQQSIEGLIEIFDYDCWGAVPCDQLARHHLNPCKVGIQRGTLNPELWLEQFDFHPDRPDLVTSHTRFDDTGELISQVITDFEFEPWTPPPPPSDETDPHRVARKSSVVYPAERKNETSAEYHTVQVDVFDKGSLQLRGQGSLVDPQDPGSDPDDRFFVTVALRDRSGRVRVQVEDYGGPNVPLPDYWPDTQAEPELAPPNLPTGLARVGGTSSPLHYVNVTNYDNMGPNEIWLPDRTGQVTSYMTDAVSGDLVRQDISGLLRKNGQNATEVNPGGVGARSRIRESQLVQSEQVVWDPSDSGFLNPTSQIDYAVVSVATPKYSAAGKLVGSQVVGTEEYGTDSLALEIVVSEGGQREKRVDPYGGITWTLRDVFGRLTHTYTGTQDGATFWTGDTPVADNMVLGERRYYFGEGSRDVNLLKRLVSYRSKAADQYDMSVQAGWEPPVSDATENIAFEECGYDWQQRLVSVRRASPTQQFAHTLTYFDGHGRVRLVAEYGSTNLDTGGVNGALTLGTLDPRSRSWGALPTAAQLLSATPAPIKLVENIYSGRDSVSESREYDVSESSGARYTSRQTFYDHLNKPTLVAGSDGRQTRSEYDARGRETRRVLFAGSVELVDTISTYNTRDQLLSVRTRTRTVDANADLIGPGSTGVNCVVTYMFYWYDDVGRVIATADLGSANNSDVFANGQTEPVRTEEAPEWSSTGWHVPGASPTWISYAAITATEYDSAGRPYRSRATNGTVTQTRFDALGNERLVQVIPPGDPTSQAVKSQTITTAYHYENGRMTRVAAVRPVHLENNNGQVHWGDDDETIQITRVRYGAQVVSVPENGGSATTVSQRNDLVREVLYSSPECPCDADGSGSISVNDTFAFLSLYFAQVMPHADFNGDGIVTVQDVFDFLSCYFAPSICGEDWADGIIQPDMTFSYTMAGELHRRTDRLGTGFTYSYDDDGRQVGISADRPSGSSVAPVNEIRRAAFEFDELNRVRSARAFAETGANEYLVSESAFAYTALGDLLREQLSHGVLAGTTAPAVEYDWTFKFLGTGPIGRSRLNGIKMPVGRGIPVTQGETRLGYGLVDDLNDLVDRVETVAYKFGTAQNTAATFTYNGASSRLGVQLAGGAITQSYQTDPQLPDVDGIDRFGRPANLTYKVLGTPSVSPLFSARYTHDRSGNRTVERLSLRPASGSNGHDQSWLYAYDAHDRVLSAMVGELQTSTPAFIPATMPLRQEWQLDELGNWGGGVVGGNQLPGMREGFYHPDLGAFSADPKQATHQTNPRNEITHLKTTNPSNPSGPLQEVATFYDLNGRMITDGQFLYDYDSWGRLIQVRHLGGVIFGPNGPDPQTLSLAGDLVVHYTYDAFGRMIRRQTPSATTGRIRIEDSYYDGVRRIQDVVADVEWLPTAEGEPLPMTAHTWQSLGRAVDREYVYAADPGAFVDEVVAQIEPNGGLLYTLRDTNYNVVAIADELGQPVAQYTYFPYGGVKSADIFQSGRARNRIGFQGLFFDRFDDSSSSEPLAPGVAGFAGVYQVRNRTYNPALGRFLQRDVNATGQMLINDTAYGGQPMAWAMPVSWDTRSHYADGMNTHVAFGANPMGRGDPLGLDWDPFDMVDDYLSESVGNQAAFMASLQQGFDAAKHIAFQVAQLHPAVAIAVSVYKIANGTATWEDALNFIPGGALAGAAAKTVGRTMASTSKFAGYYATKGSWAKRNLNAASQRSGLIKQGVSCVLCMDGATSVWTPEGTTRLDDIHLGQLVLTAGDQVRDPATGRTGKYTEADVVALWHELAERVYRPVHLRIERSDGSTTDIHQLISTKELTSDGYDMLVGTNAQMWVPDAGKPHGQAGIQSGWARVIAIGESVKLGEGIAFPTLNAAPVMAVFATTQSELYAFHLETTAGAALPTSEDDTCHPIEMTATHPVWSESQSAWVAAGTLEAGDSIRTANGWGRITAITVASKDTVAYNLTVAGGATFFVGSNQTWVHNSDGDPCKLFLQITNKTTPSDIASFVFNNGARLLERHGSKAEVVRRMRSWVDNATGLTKAKRESLLRAVDDYVRTNM